jgi:hypothetical protein
MKCEICGAEEEEYDLKKCPICHKLFCQDCAVLKGGIRFCSRHCMQFFFYGEDEEGD